MISKCVITKHMKDGMTSFHANPQHLKSFIALMSSFLVISNCIICYNKGRSWTDKIFSGFSSFFKWIALFDHSSMRIAVATIYWFLSSQKLNFLSQIWFFKSVTILRMVEWKVCDSQAYEGWNDQFPYLSSIFERIFLLWWTYLCIFNCLKCRT